jgi:hypothetical protein
VRRGAPAEDDVPVLEEKARAAGIAIEAERARDQSPEAVAARTNRFVAGLAAMPILDPRSPRDIMDNLDALSSPSTARP